MKAVLLCAGYGTRMGSLAARFPKALLPVAGRPLLDDLVDQLVASGRVEALHVVTNHRDHAHFVDWRSTRPAGGPPIALHDDGTRHVEERLGAVGDLAFVLGRAGLEGPLLVGAGDNLFRFDLGAFLDDFAAGPGSLVLVAPERDPAKLRRSGVPEIDATGRLRRLHEKPERPPTELVCPPLYGLAPDAIAQVPAFHRDHPGADAPGHLIGWLAEHAHVRTREMRGKRLDVGHPESLEAAEAWLAEAAGAPPGEDRGA